KRYWSEAEQGRAHLVVRQRCRMRRQPAESTREHGKQRQIRVLERHTAVPQRPPAQIERMRSNLPGDREKSAFVRPEIRGVLNEEQPPHDEDIDEEQNPSHHPECSEGSAFRLQRSVTTIAAARN